MFKNRLRINALPLKLVATLFLIACCNLLYAQAPAASAIVQFSNGQTVTLTDFSSPIGIQATELITVTVQFGASSAGNPIAVDALDGGSTSVGSSLPVAGPDGSITFQFLATSDAGRNLVTVRSGPSSVSLQLWVMDSENPQNNPSNLVAVSHG